MIEIVFYKCVNMCGYSVEYLHFSYDILKTIKRFCPYKLNLHIFLLESVYLRGLKSFIWHLHRLKELHIF